MSAEPEGPRARLIEALWWSFFVAEGVISFPLDSKIADEDYGHVPALVVAVAGRRSWTRCLSA